MNHASIYFGSWTFAFQMIDSCVLSSMKKGLFLADSLHSFLTKALQVICFKNKEKTSDCNLDAETPKTGELVVGAIIKA